MANEARQAFQGVMSQGMRRPIHSILGLVSMLQEETLAPEQRLVVDTMAHTASIVSTLINDVKEMLADSRDRLPLETRPFHLHAMIRDAACVARCLTGRTEPGHVTLRVHTDDDDVLEDRLGQSLPTAAGARVAAVDI
ncbi:Os06g0579350 [Oryza sativa Japonica Group]|uniref:histidine kinase n=1 Tax=Oryza sativa subsp. japonica TaxID=39947 RepID=A0A0P0WYC8_ORYSJ|nr:Os06g0579350 [Oryza sativa Japonica Group]